MRPLVPSARTVDITSAMGRGDEKTFRVLVVGDSGVGKTSLLHLVCHNEVLSNPSWTVGCSTNVVCHEYRSGSNRLSCFVEFWDVSGHPMYKPSRKMFYRNVHGVLPPPGGGALFRGGAAARGTVASRRVTEATPRSASCSQHPQGSCWCTTCATGSPT